MKYPRILGVPEYKLEVQPLEMDLLSISAGESCFGKSEICPVNNFILCDL